MPKPVGNSAARTTHVKKSPAKSKGSTLMGVFVGLVIGVVIAAGVVWFLNRGNSPFQKTESRAEKAEAKAPAAGAPVANNGAPQALPAKPGDKQRFEFYKILPGGQEGAPAPTAPPPAEGAKDASNATAPAANETYFLQAGAFQKREDADNLKAKLALTGVEASIQEVTVPEKGKMFRVRSGPYAKSDEMNRVRNQLSQGGIQATIIKVKE